MCHLHEKMDNLLSGEPTAPAECSQSTIRSAHKHSCRCSAAGSRLTEQNTIPALSTSWSKADRQDLQAAARVEPSSPSFASVVSVQDVTGPQPSAPNEKWSQGQGRQRAKQESPRCSLHVQCPMLPPHHSYSNVRRTHPCGLTCKTAQLHLEVT